MIVFSATTLHLAIYYNEWHKWLPSSPNHYIVYQLFSIPLSFLVGICNSLNASEMKDASSTMNEIPSL